MRKFESQVDVHRNWRGRSAVDAQIGTDQCLAACQPPYSNVQVVADHALILALAFCRRHRVGQPKEMNVCGRMGTDSPRVQTRDLTFGVIGLGRIGMATARLAKTLGFSVFYYDPYLANKTEEIGGIDRSSTLEDFLRRSDIISLHCSLTQEAEHLIGERELGWMKPTAFIINTASVGIVCKQAILAALREGRLGGAGFGVTEHEAMDAFSPADIATVPNLLIICHSAFSCAEV